MTVVVAVMLLLRYMLEVHYPPSKDLIKSFQDVIVHHAVKIVIIFIPFQNFNGAHRHRLSSLQFT